MSEALHAAAQVEPEEEQEEDEQPPQPEEEQEEDEQPPQPEEEQPSGASSEKEIEQGIVKLEKEALRHRNRVSEIMGEDAQSLLPCPLCEPAIPGFRWPQPLDHDRSQAVLAAVGLGELAEREHDPEAETCDLCQGQGELLTGSKVPQQLTRPCPKCGANGWTTPEQRNAWDSTQQARTAAAGLAPAQAPQSAAASELPATDAWGRYVGHEFYGRNPVYMTAAERARDVPGAA